MNKTKKIGILGMVVLIAVLTISTASADDPTLYFVPQYSNVSGYGDTTNVEIWLNVPADTDVAYGQLGFSYDPLCGNITSRTLNAGYPPKPIDPSWSTWNYYTMENTCWDNTHDWIVYSFWWPQSGVDVMIGNFTIQGNSTGYCMNNLNFTYMIGCPQGKIYMWNSTDDKISFDLTNGTFTCGTPAETYTISGYTDPVAEKVNITNLNKSDVVDDRPADHIDPVTGAYNLTLNVPDEIEAGNVLQITACEELGDHESNCNVTDHVVVNITGEENVNLTLNHFCRNYMTFPYRTWGESNWSGPAVMQMMVDHYRPEEPAQSYLNETGMAHNQGCNADLLHVDPAGMKWTLNDILHNTSSYGGGKYANYGIGSSTDINDTLHYMCKWHYLGPGAAPAYGDYSNWMVVRGIHTDVKPTFTQGSYTIFGFWMNDPYNKTLEGPGGIGENTYKSVEQWKSTYHKMLNVNLSDNYNGTYVAVCEPPEDDDVVVTLAKAKPRFTDAITPELMAKPVMVYGTEQLALEKVVKDDELLKIVQAAIDGVNEELVPYDAEFAEVFAKTIPGEPVLVSSDNGNYYVVPFNVPVVKRPPVKLMPVAIERPKVNGLKKLEHVKSIAANVVIEPITIEPIKVEKTLVVVLVDVTDGSFKEASWIAEPVKYLPVSKAEALKLVLGEIDILSATELSYLSSKPTIELVYTDKSPYYPDWKITVDGKVFYVAQDGTVS